MTIRSLITAIFVFVTTSAFADDWKEVAAPLLRGEVKQLKLDKKIYRTDSRTTLKNLHNVVIDGNGATLLMSRQDHIFKLEDCSNITLRNLTLDFDPLIFTQVVVTKVSSDGKLIEFEVEKGYPDLEPRLIARESLDVFRPDGSFRFDMARVAGMPEIITPRKGKMTIALSDGKKVDAGDRIPIGRRFANVIQTVGCENTVFENLTIHGSGCFAIGIRYSGGGDRITNVRVVPGPRPDGADTDRLRSTNGDGFNVSFSRDYPIVTGCEISGSNDDAINFHAGDIMPLYEGEDSGVKFRTIRPNSTEYDRIFKAFRPGDEVLVLRGNKNFAIAGKAKIRSVRLAERPAEFEELKLYFDRAARLNNARRYTPTAYEIEFEPPEFQLENGMFFQMIPAGRPYRIADNYFHDHRARGMRIMVPDGVIENNRIERVTDGAITLGAEYEYWNEAGWVSNVTVRNNTIRDVGMSSIPLKNSYIGGAISTFIRLRDYREVPEGHSHIRITGNRITNCAGAGVFLIGTRDSEVSGNILENVANSPDVPGAAHGFSGMQPIWVLQSSGITGKNIIDGKEIGVQ